MPKTKKLKKSKKSAKPKTKRQIRKPKKIDIVSQGEVDIESIDLVNGESDEGLSEDDFFDDGSSYGDNYTQN